MGGPGRLPAPSPGSVGGAARGGGGVAGQVLPGSFEQGRGDLWQASRELKWRVFPASWRVFIAGESSRLPWQIFLAGHFGGLFLRVILAHLFGGFSWLMKQAGSKGKEKQKKRKQNVYSVDL